MDMSIKTVTDGDKPNICLRLRLRVGHHIFMLPLVMDVEIVETLRRWDVQPLSSVLGSWLPMFAFAFTPFLIDST
jgi:hypothetical protein